MASTTYRVAQMDVENLQLSWIWDVLPSCLGEVDTVAAQQLPELSELSQLEVFHVHLGHPVINIVLNQTKFQSAPFSRVAERSKDFAKSWTKMAEGRSNADLFNFRDWAKL